MTPSEKQELMDFIKKNLKITIEDVSGYTKISLVLNGEEFSYDSLYSSYKSED